MREALARSDFDAVRRPSAPKRPRGQMPSTSRKLGKRDTKPMTVRIAARLKMLLLSMSGLALSAAANALRRYPVLLGGGLVGVGLTTAIIINAAFMQEGRHPSPLFAQANTKQANTKMVPSALPAPKPPALRPSEMPPVQAPAQPAPPKRNETAVASASIPNDPIAQLLATGTPPREDKPTGVLNVQKALVKLGYDVTTDGLMGPGTRQAIIAFEKLEKLPQTGDPANAAMRKALSVASGLALN